MTLATIVMICLICVGCALGIAGLAVAGYHGLKLLKAARRAEISTKSDLQVVMRKARDLGPRVQETKRKYEVVTERLRSLSVTTDNLNHLWDELDRATGRLSHLKF